MKRRALHRLVFASAAVYNISWGLYAAADPQWFFRFAGMPLINHPPIFTGLGLVIAAFGILYAEVMRRPEHGFLTAAAGMVGKILGVVGLAGLIHQGVWPPASVVLTLTNDIIWLAPFALYLHDSWPAYRSTFGVEPLPGTLRS